MRLKRMFKSRKVKYIFFLFMILVILVYGDRTITFSVADETARTITVQDPFEIPTTGGGTFKYKIRDHTPISALQAIVMAVFPSTVRAGQQFTGTWNFEVEGCSIVYNPSSKTFVYGPQTSSGRYEDTIWVSVPGPKMMGQDVDVVFKYTYPKGLPSGSSDLNARLFEAKTGASCYTASKWDVATVYIEGDVAQIDCTSQEKVYNYYCAGDGKTVREITKRDSNDCPVESKKVKTCQSGCTMRGNDLNSMCVEDTECMVGSMKCKNGYIIRCSDPSGGYVVVKTCKSGSCAEGFDEWMVVLDESEIDLMCTIPKKGDTGPSEDDAPDIATYSILDGQCVEVSDGKGKYSNIDQCRVALKQQKISLTGSDDEDVECENGEEKIWVCHDKKQSEIVTKVCKNGEWKPTSNSCPACSDDEDCEEGAKCIGDLCKIPSEEDECEEDSDCSEGMECVDGICEVPKVDGDGYTSTQLAILMVTGLAVVIILFGVK